MSVQAISWVLDFSTAGGVDRLVMIILGHHADNDGYVAVARARVAAETRLSDVTVKRIIDRLVDETDELTEADQGYAPDWWLAIRPNRRPRLLRMPLFAATREAVGLGAHSEPPAGGALGARRGRAGVHDTPSDQPKRGAIDDRQIDIEEAPPDANATPPDPDCIRCRGRGSFFSGAGFDQVCPCCDPRPRVASESAADA